MGLDEHPAAVGQVHAVGDRHVATVYPGRGNDGACECLFDYT